MSKSSCPSLGPEMRCSSSREVPPSGDRILRAGWSKAGRGCRGFEGWAGSWVGSCESLSLSCCPGSRPQSSRRQNPGVLAVGESKEDQVMCQEGSMLLPRWLSRVSCQSPVGECRNHRGPTQRSLVPSPCPTLPPLLGSA